MEEKERYTNGGYHIFSPEFLNQDFSSSSSSSSDSVSSYTLSRTKSQSNASNNGGESNKSNNNESSKAESSGKSSKKKHKLILHPDGIPAELQISEVQVLSKFLKSQHAQTVMEDFAKRASVISSIHHFSAHVPAIVLNGLEKEVREMEKMMSTTNTNGLKPLTQHSLATAEIEEEKSEDDVSDLSDTENMFGEQHLVSMEDDEDDDDDFFGSAVDNYGNSTKSSTSLQRSDSELSYDLFAAEDSYYPSNKNKSNKKSKVDWGYNSNSSSGSDTGFPFATDAKPKTRQARRFSNSKSNVWGTHKDNDQPWQRNTSLTSSNSSRRSSETNGSTMFMNGRILAAETKTRRLSASVIPLSSSNNDKSNTAPSFHTTRLRKITSMDKLQESKGDMSHASTSTMATKTSKRSNSTAPPTRRIIKYNHNTRIKAFNDSMSISASSSDGASTQFSMPRLTLNEMLTHKEDDDEEDSFTDDGRIVVTGQPDDDIQLARRAMGIGFGPPKSKTYKDPFPFDSDDEKQLKTRNLHPKSNTNNSKLPRVRRPTLIRQRSHAGSTRNVTSRRPSKIVGGRTNHHAQTEDHVLLPHSSAHQAALLFVDISGFTKLATNLDPESLSKAINSYFELIVNEVTSFGGDVLKFAGDAVFCEWKTGDTTGKRLTLVECVAVASSCGASIVERCSDFPIYEQKNNDIVATLNVHCGIGVGEIVGVHVGDYETRREYLILGDPIDQVAAAVNVASLGEVAASPQAIMTLSKTCDILDSQISTTATKPVVIAQRSTVKFRARGGTHHMAPTAKNGGTTTTTTAMSQRVESWHIDTLNQYRKLMSLYVHPVTVDNDSSHTVINQGHNTPIQERHREEAELRSVYTMFITPLISVRVTGNAEADRQLYKLLNNIMNLCTRELTRFSGHLRQFIVDDKGLVLIATFGLRGSTFPNMVGERALPASITIHNALRHELGVQNQVGGTIGNAYCGVVGGIKRHEYAILGPSVNLAARLMSSPKNPGILVDDAVRLMADKSYGFNALPPVKAKGYTKLVPIFEPLSPLERSWGRVQPNFVGRKKLILQLMRTAREMALTQCRSKMVYFSAESGMGKSTMVVHAIEHIRRIMGGSRRRLIVTKHVSKESDLLVPFGIFRSILVDVLSYFRGAQDDRSLISYGNASAGGLESIGWESLSGGSVSNSTATGLTRSRDRLGSICRELNAPPVFQELVGRHLLGLEGNKNSAQFRRGSKGNNMKSLVNFMARAFKRCTQEASLVIIALDDVHYMDDMSWKVVQELFDTGQSILFLCTSRPTSTYRLAVDKDFWEKLKSSYTNDGRFELVNMERLSEKEMRLMIAKTLGLQEREVSSTLLNDVSQQSNGMPHFANEILETIKRKNSSSSQDHTAELTFVSVGELLLHRLDSFDATVRNVLNLGAVLGSSFELTEIVAVIKKTNAEEKDPYDQAVKDLEMAVSEGILYVVHDNAADGANNDDMIDDPPAFHESFALQESRNSFASSTRQSKDGSASNVLFTFCHDIWRTTILKLMLDSRKKDLHRIIAETLEEQQGAVTKDYLSRMKLFSHWKASGNTTKAASLTMTVGKSFEELGLHDQSIKLYEDALDMWKRHKDDDSKSPRECSSYLMDSLSAADLADVIRVYIALGQCLANVHRAAESVAAYQNALKTLSTSAVANELKDRSIVFPIFSGLFAALKFGQLEQDSERSYELSLVEQFVQETKLHGDPVHYARALAMQADTFGRLGQYDNALEAHSKLTKIYSVDKHSYAICDAYGSDRAGQSYALRACWFGMLGQNAKAVEACWYVIKKLLPKMDPSNVHNSCLMIYPLLWVLKDNGCAVNARDAFVSFVVEPFNKYFGEGRTTFCLPIYDPVLCLLDLAGNKNLPAEDLDEYLDWALSEENLRFGTVLNTSLGGYGRCADCISAEICLLLGKRLHSNDEDKRLLIENGIFLAQETKCLIEQKDLFLAEAQLNPVQKELMALAQQMNIELPK